MFSNKDSVYLVIKNIEEWYLILTLLRKNINLITQRLKHFTSKVIANYSFLRRFTNT
jgi:hypothetical protein